MTNEVRSADLRADYVSGWLTGIGIGLAVFMVTWIVANRITGMIMPVPAGPLTAMGIAVLTGTVIAIRQGWRLSRRFVAN